MTTDQLQAEIERLKDEWVPLLWINEFEVNVAFGEGEDTANATTDTAYVMHTVWFNLPRIAWKMEHDGLFDLEEYVVHELIHAYTARLWTLSQQLVAGKDLQHVWHWMFEQMYEEVTQRMSNALMAVKRAHSGSS
jgi:hypothetical protein